MTRHGWFLTAGAILVVGIVVAAVFVAPDHLREGPPAARVIDYETTRITEPRREDGRVDFEAALNAGPVPSPEENAAIPLLRALGTQCLPGDGEEILRSLHAPPDLPVTGPFALPDLEVPYFSDFEELDDETDRKAFRGWVDGNADALELLVAAARRPHLWFPIRREAGLLQAALPLNEMGDLVRVLTARASMRLADGNVRTGWEDALVLMALRKLVGQLPGFLYHLVADSFDGMALDWIEKALRGDALDTALCADIIDRLQESEPRWDVVAALDRAERLVVLDAYIELVTQEIRDSGGDPAWHPANTPIDAVLRQVNCVFDEVLPLLASRDRASCERIEIYVADRMKRLESVRADLKGAGGVLEHACRQLTTGGAHVGRQVGDILADMILVVLPSLVAHDVERTERRQGLVLAAALRAHALRTGGFPESLEELAPATLASLPRTTRVRGDVTYERTDEGCRIAIGEWELELGK